MIVPATTTTAMNGSARYGLVALVVDPSETRRRELLAALDRQGVKVSGHAGTSEALAAAAQVPDLALIAASLLAPEHDDFSAKLRTAAGRPSLFEVAIAGDETEGQGALARGVDDYIVWGDRSAAARGRLRAALRQAAVHGWMDTIQQASELVSGARSVNGLFIKVARRLRRMLPLDHFVVARNEGAEVRLDVVDMVGDAERPWSFCLRLPQSQACPQRFMPREQRLIVCDQVRDQDPRLAAGMRSCICLSLQDEGRSLGALSLASREPRAFDEGILPYLASLAVQVAHALIHIERYQQARGEAEYLTTIVREVHHRIKNNLQGVIGLLARHAESDPVHATGYQHAVSQLHAVAEVHNLLSHHTRERVALHDLVAGVCRATASLSPHPIECGTGADTAGLDVAASEAVPLALVLNELIQNAIRHGYPDGRRGTIRVTLGLDNDRPVLRVANDGVGPPAGAPPDEAGIGLNLVRALLPKHGRFRLLREDGWTVAEIRLGPITGSTVEPA